MIPLTEEIGRHTGESVIWVLFGVTIGLLLIACSDVTNLLLIRDVSLPNSLRDSSSNVTVAALPT